MNLFENKEDPSLVVNVIGESNETIRYEVISDNGGSILNSEWRPYQQYMEKEKFHMDFKPFEGGSEDDEEEIQNHTPKDDDWEYWAKYLAIETSLHKIVEKLMTGNVSQLSSEHLHKLFIFVNSPNKVDNQVSVDCRLELVYNNKEDSTSLTIQITREGKI